MCPAICNMKVPGSFPIPLGVFPGRIIRVKGRTPACSQRFAINLQCGPKMHPDEVIAFHFNPRFAEKCVVRNHYECSKWGVEEISDSVPMNSGDWRPVEVNGQFICEFAHRIPYCKITHIMVDGDVEVDEIDFVGANPPADINLIVPFAVPIPGGMRPGCTIGVQGATPPDVKRFAINLQCGPKLYPDEDIAFHFNPRFKQGSVVRNHFVASSCWGVEETSGTLPLTTGEPFEVLIHCYQDHFKAFLNGIHVCDFTHRISMDKITHIMVDGDAIIYKIDFNASQDPCSQQPVETQCGCEEVPGPF